VWTSLPSHDSAFESKGQTPESALFFGNAPSPPTLLRHHTDRPARAACHPCQVPLPAVVTANGAHRVSAGARLASGGLRGIAEGDCAILAFNALLARLANVQRIFWLSLMLIVLGWVATELPSGTTGNEPTMATAWRRTRDGWVRHSTLVISQPAPPPHLHPAVLAAFEGLLSLAGMVAFLPRRLS
jgi:hypothetical protein